MPPLTFQTLSFALEESKDERNARKKEPITELKVTLLNLFVTKIPLSELNQIGEFRLKDTHTLEFKNVSEKKVKLKFFGLLAKAFESLTNTINGNKAVYIHRNSGIPLLGSVEFGIVYRNSSLIEVKPVTSCNLNCIYCSVGEGTSSNKTDFVVEKDYLVEELERLIEFVGEPVEMHIGVQGEPFLYGDLIPLIEDLQKNPEIKTISMDTNFTLVGKNTIEQLAKFSKLQLNVSLDALDEKLAEVLAGCAYNLKHVQEMIKYAAKKGIKLLIAPVLVPGYNENEMEGIVRWVKELKIPHADKRPLLGIQNYLTYKTGRAPAKAWDWQRFYEFISELEKKTGVGLKLSPDKFGIHKTKELPKPFVVDEVIQAVIKASDRFPHTCLAVAKGRVISVPECNFRGEKKVKIKITRDKHNCFGGKMVR